MDYEDLSDEVTGGQQAEDDPEVQEIKEKMKVLEESPFSVQYDPIEFIKECLVYHNKEIRIRASKLAGSFPNADFIEPLFNMAAEEHDLDVREAAIRTLGRFLHHGRMADYHHEVEADIADEASMSELSREQFNVIREFMSELVSSRDWPDRLRATALEFYARHMGDEAQSTIEQFYRSGEGKLVEGAVRAIARLKSGDWENLITKEILREASDERKLSAVEAAGIHDIEEAGPELVNIIENTDNESFRQAAVESLSMLSWPEAPNHLEPLTEDEDPVVRELAEDGMNRWAHEMERQDML